VATTDVVQPDIIARTHAVTAVVALGGAGMMAERLAAAMCSVTGASDAGPGADGRAGMGTRVVAADGAATRLVGAEAAAPAWVGSGPVGARRMMPVAVLSGAGGASGPVGARRMIRV